MNKFQILHFGNEPHEEASSIARTVVDSILRPISEVRVTGVAPLLTEYVNPDAVDILINAGLRIDEDTLQGTVSATPEICEAVFSLFSDSLLNAEFIDESGNPVFTRKDSDADFAYLRPSEYEQVASKLRTDLLARIYPVSSGVSVAQFPDGENPAEGTALTEYKFTGSAGEGAASQHVLWDLIDSLDRDVGQLQFCGLVPVLNQIDQNALSVLQSADVDMTDRLVSGDLPATDQRLRALQTLWSDGIHYLYLIDTNGKPLFLRESPRNDYLYIHGSEYQIIENSNPGMLRRSYRW